MALKAPLGVMLYFEGTLRDEDIVIGAGPPLTPLAGRYLE